MGVLLTATSLNHSAVITDYETFVSVLQPCALKIAIQGMALWPGKPKSHNTFTCYTFSVQELYKQLQLKDNANLIVDKLLYPVISCHIDCNKIQ